MHSMVGRGYLVIGGGTLGRALTQQFTGSGAKIFGVFDEDIKVGRCVSHAPQDTRLAPGSYRGLKVSPAARVHEYVNAFNCTTAILAVPPANAQRAAQLCVDAGIKRILNYTLCDVSMPGVDIQTAFGSPQAASRFEDDFEILGTLGRGGFGRVYRVRHRIDGQEYAVKRVALPSAEAEAEEIVAEAESMARLSNHPNVCRYHASWVETSTFECSMSESSDSDEDSEDGDVTEASEANPGSSGSLYIQMELCGGLTLQDYLQNDRAWTDGTHQTRIAIFSQLVEATEHIHSQGYVHKDIKPANCMLSDDLVPKLGDFGLCTPCNDGAHAGAGTALYMPPEFETSLSEGIDWRPADVYALGVVLLEVCWRFSTQMERISTITDLKSNHTLPSELLMNLPSESALIMAMTHHNPSKRPTLQQVRDSELLRGAQGRSLHLPAARKVLLQGLCATCMVAMATRDSIAEGMLEKISDLASLSDRSNLIMPGEELSKSWLMQILEDNAPIDPVALAHFVTEAHNHALQLTVALMN